MVTNPATKLSENNYLLQTLYRAIKPACIILDTDQYPQHILFINVGIVFQNINNFPVLNEGIHEYIAKSVQYDKI